MQEVTINFEKFDFNRLVDKTLEFSKQHFNQYYAIPWINKIGDNPVYSKNINDVIDYENLPEPTDRDFLNELTHEDKFLFFSFSTNNAGEPVSCANDKSYEPEEDNEWEDPDDFNLGYTENLGYLLKYFHGQLTINSAINSCGACMFPPSIDLLQNAGIFDGPMYEFIKTFIKEK